MTIFDRGPWLSKLNVYLKLHNIVYCASSRICMCIKVFARLSTWKIIDFFTPELYGNFILIEGLFIDNYWYVTLLNICISTVVTPATHSVQTRTVLGAVKLRRSARRTYYGMAQQLGHWGWFTMSQKTESCVLCGKLHALLYYRYHSHHSSVTNAALCFFLVHFRFGIQPVKSVFNHLVLLSTGVLIVVCSRLMSQCRTPSRTWTAGVMNFSSKLVQETQTISHLLFLVTRLIWNQERWVHLRYASFFVSCLLMFKALLKWWFEMCGIVICLNALHLAISNNRSEDQQLKRR